MQALRAPLTVRADQLVRQETWRFIGAYGIALVVALAIGVMSLVNPRVGFPVAAGLFLLGVAVTAVRPVFGVYAITFFGLLADNVSAPSWPFLKNGSSIESLLYVNDLVIFSPMEAFLAITVLVTLVHVALRRVELTVPPMVGPLALFMMFVGVGTVWGLGRGGNLIVGLWEARPFLALFVLYLLATTLITSRAQVRLLFATIIAAIVLEALRTIYWYLTTAEAIFFDSLVEHAGATHMNFLFIAAILAWLTARTSLGLRLVLPLAAAPALWVYFESERRSAIAALLIGIVISLLFLRADNPVRFMKIAPMLTLFVIGYLAVFWNASGALAFPAEAIRAQISPDTASAADRASDSYRVIEHLDILATIRSNPLLGVGFGQQYDRPIPLPDISFGFIWWEYITHNGLMWIWLKTGFFGFVAMFNFLGRGIVAGMRTTLAESNPIDKVILASVAVFVPMYAVYTYVDIAWGTQSMILLAICLAIIAKTATFQQAEAEASVAPLELEATT